jgi:hypothetical protein
MPAGRPSSYKAEYAEQAKKLALLGATDQEMADFFKVDVRTVHRWKHEHDEFCHALKAGKEAADDRVERSLYQRAIGYEQDEVKIFMPGGAKEPVYAPFRAKVAPDTTAAIFWLKNRRSADWRDKQEIEHSGGVKHSYDLSSLPDEKLGELERILADAERGSGGPSETQPSQVH